MRARRTQVLVFMVGVLGVVLSTGGAVSATTTRARTVEDLPYDATVSVPCANGGVGEDVHVTGTIRVSTTFVEDAKGGIHAPLHVVFDGVVGVGATTGALYTAHGATEIGLNLGPDRAVTLPVVTTFVLTSRGGASLVMHTTFALTINANGEVTSQQTNVVANCEGKVSRANLLPTAITYTPSSPVVGQQVYFDSGITNNGDVDTGVFNIKWFVDGQEVGAYGSHQGVPAGQTILDGNSQFQWIFTSAGTHTVTFVVDVDNHVQESDEADNAGSIDVVVGP